MPVDFDDHLSPSERFRKSERDNEVADKNATYFYSELQRHSAIDRMYGDKDYEMTRKEKFTWFMDTSFWGGVIRVVELAVLALVAWFVLFGACRWLAGV